MQDAKRWTVVIDIEHLEGHTRAHAHLHRRESDAMTTVGTAYWGVAVETCPDSLARESAARALSALAQDLDQVAALRYADTRAGIGAG